MYYVIKSKEKDEFLKKFIAFLLKDCDNKERKEFADRLNEKFCLACGEVCLICFCQSENYYDSTCNT